MKTALHKGMLRDIDPQLLNSEVPDKESRVQSAFPPELQYACRYWIAHCLAATEGGVEVAESLDVFAAKSLIPWVEAMSWLDDVRLGLCTS